MTPDTLSEYRTRLERLLESVRDVAADLGNEARAGLGGESGGGLSNAPLHLGDLGTAAFSQELTATLLEGEEGLHAEVRAALDRVDAGTFGRCEGCGAGVPPERLDVVPYTRYCVRCAAAAESGPGANLNTGRPRAFDLPGPADDRAGDVHAAGTAGGGTAVGGLAGTNVGDGDPANADLEGATGSGAFDAADAGDEDPSGGYSGPAGGAVGGTPAGKRVRGGRTGHG